MNTVQDTWISCSVPLALVLALGLVLGCADITEPEEPLAPEAPAAVLPTALSGIEDLVQRVAPMLQGEGAGEVKAQLIAVRDAMYGKSGSTLADAVGRAEQTLTAYASTATAAADAADLDVIRLGLAVLTPAPR